MIKLILMIVGLNFLTSNVQCASEHIPNLPTNRRTQYYLQKNTGGYKYGFDTGNGYFAKQSANDENQVEGHFAYPIDGKLIDVKYTAGKQGYVLENINSSGQKSSLPAVSYSSKSNIENSNDGSYSFSYETDHSAREESADTNGNVRGYYSYQNDAGNHDLSYTAGGDSGFVVTGGSLAAPTSLNVGSYDQHTESWSPHLASGQKTSLPAVSYSSKSNIENNNDGSYSFSYETDHSALEESADTNGNVRGYYSYQNDAGNHDLSYTAGGDSEFVVTGGNLAAPTSLNVGSYDQDTESWSPHLASGQKTSLPAVSYSTKSNIENNNDGSYSFSYETDHSAREESADTKGNVRGYYSYQNDAGNHDLSYTAGGDSGFVVTGGNLAAPTSLNVGYYDQDTESWSPHLASGQKTSLPAVSYSSKSNIENSNDGSYSFSYETDHSAREESADVNGNVRGYYAYQNDAGSHDLSYTAGGDSGFVVTGGSLAPAKQIDANIESIIPFPQERRLFKSTGQSSEPNIPSDGSYKFVINTDNYKREEESDSQGNIRGKYSYNNNVGSHDLYYVAGSDTGFIATGGSLSEANGLIGKSSPIESENIDSSLLKAIPLTKLNHVQKTISDNIHIKPDIISHDNIVVQSILPGDNNYKTGYIFDSK